MQEIEIRFYCLKPFSLYKLQRLTNMNILLTKINGTLSDPRIKI